MKNKRGFAFIELLIVVAIVSIVAGIIIPAMIDIRFFNQFKTSYGIPLKRAPLSEIEKSLLQPLVTARLGELRQRVDSIQKNRIATLSLPPSTDTTEVNRRLKELAASEDQLEAAQQQLNKAIAAAKYFFVLPQ